MKPKSQNRTCPDLLSNQCIVWEGGDVPVLGIYNGDQVSQSEFTIASKIVELFDDIDMSKIDMSCLQATCSQKCKDTSLKSIVQVLFDNQCCLADLINTQSSTPTTVTLNLNLRCLTVFDDFGNPVPQDLNQTLQTIVNQVCTSASDITLLQNTVQSLQSQIDAIPLTPTAPAEPNITTCITPGLRPTSQTVPLVAQSLCDLQTAIGTAADMSIAISQQCANLNSTFSGVNGWLASVANFAQSMNNLWLVACNLNTRITNIENTCCLATCADVEVGFEVQIDSSSTGVFLKFTAGAGTSIPAAFTDGGSSVIFTDKNGSTLSYPLIIANNANLGDFDLSGLDLNDPITISVTAILSNGTLTCEKCITRLYTLAGGACPVCAVTASGTNGTSTILYIVGSTTISSTTQYQTLILAPNQTGYVPKNATIVKVTNTGDTSSDSTCINLTPPPQVCYVFKWEHNLDSGEGQEIDDWFFSQISAGAGQVTFTIGTTISDAPYVPTCNPIGPILILPAGAKLLSAINSSIPNGIIQAMCVITDNCEDSAISVQLPQTLGVPELQISNPLSGGPDFLYLKGILSTNGTDCSCGDSLS